MSPTSILRRSSASLALLFWLGAGCSTPETPAEDTGTPIDAPSTTDVPEGSDAGLDAAIESDAAAEDAPGTDAGGPPADAAVLDAPSTTDAGPPSMAAPSGPGARRLDAPVTARVRRGTRNTPVTAHVPTGTDRLPLVVFLPGFQLNLDQYEGTLTRIASHGFVVVGGDPPASLTSANHVEMAADARAVLDWALMAGGPVEARIDASRIAMMGHSLGGKLSTMVAFADDRVGAILLLDPVNGGAGPTGYTRTAPDIVPDQVSPLSIPIGILGETNNATGGAFGMSCAPAAQNYTTFYDAAESSPALAEWTLTGADHMDFLDDPMCGFTCSACPDGPGVDADQLAIARTLSVAFLRRYLQADTAMDTWLTGTDVPAGVTVRHAP